MGFFSLEFSLRSAVCHRTCNKCRQKWVIAIWVLCRYPAKSLISNVAVYINHQNTPGIFYCTSFGVAHSHRIGDNPKKKILSDWFRFKKKCYSGFLFEEPYQTRCLLSSASSLFMTKRHWFCSEPVSSIVWRMRVLPFGRRPVSRNNVTVVSSEAYWNHFVESKPQVWSSPCVFESWIELYFKKIIKK